MDDDFLPPLLPPRPRTADPRLRRVWIARQATAWPLQEPVCLPQLHRGHPLPQRIQPQPMQPVQITPRPQDPQRILGAERNMVIHTLADQVQNEGFTSIEKNDVPLTPLPLTRTAGKVKDTPEVVEVKGQVQDTPEVVEVQGQVQDTPEVVEVKGEVQDTPGVVEVKGEVQDTSGVVEVTGGTLQTAEVYRFYFEGNKHGGDVKDVKVDQQNCVVYVTFVNEKVAGRVVQHKHMIRNEVVEVRLSDSTHLPHPDYYPDKLLFHNVDVSLNKQHLLFYFQKVARCDLTEDQIVFGDTRGEVLATFQQPPDLERTEGNCRQYRLQGRQVSVSRVVKSDCVIVENLNPRSTEESICNYFENPRKGGALVQSLKASADNRQCLVSFCNWQAAERVAERPHRLEGHDLKVKVYLACLGPSAGGFGPSDFCFPPPVPVDIPHPLVRRFFRETAKVQRDWSKTFKPLHATLSFGTGEEDPIMVSCNLEKRQPQCRKLADGWKDKVDKAVRSMLASVGVGHVPVKLHSWEDAENHIKGKFSLNRNTAILVPDEDQRVIFVVGLHEKLQKNIQKVSKAVAKVEERNMKRKKDTLNLESYQMDLLIKCDFFQKATQHLQEFSFTTNPRKGTVLLEGVSVDVQEVRSRAEKLLGTVISRQLTKLPAIQRKLLDRDDTVQAIDNSLKEQGVVAAWEKVDKKVNIHAFGEADAWKAEKTIFKHVLMEKCSLSIESTQLLKTSQIQEILQGLRDKYPGSVCIEKPAEKEILIAGFCAREIKKDLETYMLENTIYRERVRFLRSRQEIIQTVLKDRLEVIQTALQTYRVQIICEQREQAISITGTSQGLKEAHTQLQELGQQILCHSHQLTEPDQITFLFSKKCETSRKRIVSYSHCVLSMQEEVSDLQVLESTRPPTPQPDHDDLQEDEDSTEDENNEMSDDSGDHDSVKDRALPTGILVQPGLGREGRGSGVEEGPGGREAEDEVWEAQEERRPVSERISIMMADITQLPLAVDVIVNAANDQLEHLGGLAKYIVEKGGQSIQEESRALMQKLGRTLHEGEVVVTGAGRLPCREIFHAVGPSYRTGKGGEGDRLALTVRNCLQRACDSRYRTIAIPAISTGIFRYPIEEASLVLLKAAKEFLQTRPDCCLQSVIFCDTSEDKVRYFLSAKEALFPPSWPSAREAGVPAGAPVQRTGATVPQTIIKVSVVKGEVAKQQTDVVVNSISRDANLTNGKVSHSILLQAGPGLQTEIRTKYPQQLNVGDVAITSAHGLQSRYVFHVVLSHWSANSSPQQLQRVMQTCLSEADHLSCSSIAFPALGTGALRYPEAMVAQTMLQAVLHFEQTHPTTPLREVRVVVYYFDHSIFQAFDNARTPGGGSPALSAPTPAPPTHLPRDMTPAPHLLSPAPPDSPDIDQDTAGGLSLRKKGSEMCKSGQKYPDTVTLYIYAMTETLIWQFIKDFDAIVRESFVSDTWTEEQLGKKNQQFMQKMDRAAKCREVDITINRPKGTITLHGFKEDVLHAKVDIQKILRKAMQVEYEEEKKDIYANFAQWSRLLEDSEESMAMKEYPKEQNSIIERAFHGGEKAVQFVSSSRLYIVDFNEMVESPVGDPSKKVAVLRRVKVQDQQYIEMPSHWEAQPTKLNLKLVPVLSGTPEFQCVADNFHATIDSNQLTIVQITRIQNLTQYQQYQVKRKEMERQNQDVANVQNELLLWHGTAKEATNNINRYGFNRSYCGKNATAHGKGVYFAVRAEYSARNVYSPPDQEGQRYMYQSKVLVGVSCACNQNMSFLPDRTANVKYDSSCDNVKNPGIYVIFNDTQAYPEYVITFKNV